MLFCRLPKILTDYQNAVLDARTANEGYEGSLHVGILDIYNLSAYLTQFFTLFRKRNSYLLPAFHWLICPISCITER